MNQEKYNPVNHCKIIRRRTQSSTTSLTYVGGNLEMPPIDLIIEILQRLPAKTIAKLRCVSKQWGSLLSNPDFTKSFLTCSSTRPRLLFTFEFGGKWHFFSSPQPRNVDEQIVIADYHMGFSGDWYKEICQSANGFIYLYDKQMFKEKIERVPVICNPSTGQKVHLPIVIAKNNDLRSFLGYDPIENQLKVLCMAVAKYNQQTNSREHKVLTLGKGKPSWRNIECLFPHFPKNYKNGICINGILYYIARSNLNTVIACFDVKYEKFRFIQIDEESSILTWFLTLINYKGKLAALVFDQSLHDQLWVLDDPENEKWSKHIFHLPTAAFVVIRSIWATDSGEIVWAPSRWTYPFYVFYYNMERQSVRRFEIKGIEEKALMGHYRPEAIFTFTNHVENVMFL
ncbi:PREDICTED: putative F-box protein At1g46984 [Brassica oleracea var. oleracea]|uniref:F-box domain-containing protein n=1 Tax=Brassica oleracea var. oleracea TaxID=109376 RepID=A0A0D3CGT5_BRAOL|nr:PREDICTED: putative F-box protein At1g46984 [Brassica oleracea var. oleracea]